jgi:hypothetical protein
LLNGKGFEGSILDLIEVISQCMPGETEENRENFIQDSQWVPVKIQTENLSNT